MGKELYVTAREAAQMFCVTKQSVYNYVNEGLLDGVKRMGKIYVLKSSIRKYTKLNTKTMEERQRIVEEMEKKLDEDMKRINVLIRSVESDKKYIRESMMDNNCFAQLVHMRFVFYTFIRSALICFDEYPNGSMVADIFRDIFAAGYSMSDVSRRRGISHEYLRKLITTAFSRMERLTKYSELIERNKALFAENEDLKAKLMDMDCRMKLHGCSPSDSGYFPEQTLSELMQSAVEANLSKSVLGRKICNICNSARLVSISLHGGVGTLYDLARMKRERFFKYRNVGVKTVREAEKLLSRYGLSFGMSMEDIYLYMRSEEENNRSCV